MAREKFKTLTEPMYYILLALFEERRGIDIMDVVQQISEKRVSVGPGTMYAMLQKFEDNDIIVTTRTEGRQKWYVITERGKQMLLGEMERQRQMIRDGERVLNKKQ